MGLFNRRLTNSTIQFAPNYLFRVVLVNIVLFPLFFDFINIFKHFLHFYIFYHILAFTTFLSIITCFKLIYANLENFYTLENDLGEVETS